MKRVAALYDLHGNIAALEAVLAEVRSADADLVVFGGDLAWGPFPRETVELAMDPGLPALYVRGNADREVAEPEWAEPEWVAEVTSWCAARLDERHRTFLLGQSTTADVHVDGIGDVLFCHGSPRGDEDPLTAITPETRLADALAGVSAGLVVCGHTHMQFDRTSGRTRVVNAGSVGMPYEGAPGAYWALIDETVTLRKTAYDYAAAAAAVADSGCPYASDFAKDLLEPPGRAETEARFEPSPG